mmetsp:Transcript_69629/g.151503  ORF Transcript_69629/g.151503 Transcript_69629/m.151503 type:complete len:202 (-) Transcript_69629:725-1330(-)
MAWASSFRWSRFGTWPRSALRFCASCASILRALAKNHLEGSLMPEVSFTSSNLAHRVRRSCAVSSLSLLAASSSMPCSSKELKISAFSSSSWSFFHVLGTPPLPPVTRATTLLRALEKSQPEGFRKEPSSIFARSSSMSSSRSKGSSSCSFSMHGPSRGTPGSSGSSSISSFPMSCVAKAFLLLQIEGTPAFLASMVLAFA